MVRKALGVGYFAVLIFSFNFTKETIKFPACWVPSSNLYCVYLKFAVKLISTTEQE